jgi:hypothetical protein
MSRRGTERVLAGSVASFGLKGVGYEVGAPPMNLYL